MPTHGDHVLRVALVRQADDHRHLRRAVAVLTPLAARVDVLIVQPDSLRLLVHYALVNLRFPGSTSLVNESRGRAHIFPSCS